MLLALTRRFGRLRPHGSCIGAPISSMGDEDIMETDRCTQRQTTHEAEPRDAAAVVRTPRRHV